MCADKSNHPKLNAAQGTTDPFLGCLSSKVSEVRTTSTSSSRSHQVEYIWLHLTQEGLVDTQQDAPSSVLSLQDWLNIVDESAALGAQWMVIHVETHLKPDADVWRICAWAQEVHGIRVGLHLNYPSIKESDLRSMRSLNQETTFVVVDKKALGTVDFLQAEGYTVCASNISPDDRSLPCSYTESIVCAGTDGVLFCCGMVMGDESYHLGHVHADPIDQTMRKHESLAPIHASQNTPEHNCDGCPPIMVDRFKAQKTLDKR